MARAEIEAIIKLRDEFSSKITKMDKRLGGMDRSLKRAEKSARRVGSVLGGVLGGAVILRGIKNSIQAIDKQVDAINSLNLALANQGNLLPGTSERLREYAAGIQSVTTFGDEAVIELQALLAGFGMNEEQLKRTTKATLDFATAQGIDLKAAALLLGKAFVGETGTLSRYGLIIDQSIPKTEKFDAVIQQLTSRFGGAAQAQTATLSGKIEQLSNAFGDLQEGVGSFIGFMSTSFGGGIETTLAVTQRAREFFAEDMVIAVGLMRKAILDGLAAILEGAASVGEGIDKIGSVVSKSPIRVAMEELGFATKDTNVEINENVQFLRDMATSMREGGVAMIEQAENAVIARTNLLEFKNVVGDTNIKLTEAKARLEEARAGLSLILPTVVTVGLALGEFGEEFGETSTDVTGSTASMEAAFSRWGLKTRAQLDATAARARMDFAVISASGQFTVDELTVMWDVYEKARIEAAEITSTGMLGSAEAFKEGSTAIFLAQGASFKDSAVKGVDIAVQAAIAKSLASAPWPFNLILAAGAAAAGAIVKRKIRGLAPGFRHGTPRGDFQDFGQEQNVTVHGREAIIPVGGGNALAQEIASAGGVAGAGGGPISITMAPNINVKTLATDERALAVELAPVLNQMLAGGRVTTELVRRLEGVFQRRA